MIVVKALSGSLRSKYVQSVGKQTIFDWQLQLVKSRSIYGFHLAPELFIRINLFYYITFLICRYNPSDVVKLARTVVEGKLPKPDQPIYVEKKDEFAVEAAHVLNDIRTALAIDRFECFHFR